MTRAFNAAAGKTVCKRVEMKSCASPERGHAVKFVMVGEQINMQRLDRGLDPVQFAEQQGAAWAAEQQGG